jgi:hypothetical protein
MAINAMFGSEVTYEVIREGFKGSVEENGP